MTYENLLDVIHDPLFVKTDLELRRGKHIGADNDAFMYDFLTSTQKYLEDFYESYGVRLICGPEGFFYLLPERSISPPPLGSRKLSEMDMLVGQALALMHLDPAWLATGGRIPDLRILQLLEQLIGQERLLRYAGRRRGRDNEQDAKKLRESLMASLRTLERLGFIRREGRSEAAVVRPLRPIMRFADPVRSSDPLDKALERLIFEGEIEEIENDNAEDEVTDANES